MLAGRPPHHPGSVLYNDLPTAFVDLETTGSRADLHRITEIAIVEADAAGAVTAWSTLINPGRAIPPQISALTGIDDAMVADAPHFEDLWRKVWERLDGRLFVAHNVQFDYGFLRAAFAGVGRHFRPPRVCTVRLSRRLYPEHRAHNLDALVARHQLTCEPRHRALTDAQALWEWCCKAAAERGHDALRAAVEQQLAGPPLPPGLDRARLDELRDAPGVYLFRGDGERLLYVGKSLRVRSRVRAHLGGAARGERGQKMLAQVRDVEMIPTAGELGALLLEARLIKQEMPLFNRRLRRHAQIFTLALAEDADGFLVPQVSELDASQGMDGQPRFGLYRREAAARRRLRALGEEATLCRKKLGLEHGEGSCFAWQLGRCRGACVGRQSAVAHNLKLLEALCEERLAQWPFDGPVALAEHHGDRSAFHVIDRWCHLGSTILRHELPGLADGPRVFDIDVYRIVRRHLDRSGGRASVVPLGGS
jgi:DNA polymerase-3 subunit epsilon